jgi:VIT1/CCC1 family predicted Fe2+/Mn2+ transporter
MPPPNDGLNEMDKPTPDPTILTTEQLLREVDRVKELTDSKIDGTIAVFAEKFISVGKQFDLVEQQRVEQKSDTKAAVDAALTAQKEAVKEQTIASERAIAKSEASTAKQIEQLGATFSTAISGVTDVLQDLKDRITRIESVKQGGREAYAALYAGAGFLVSLIVIVGVLAATGAFTR